MLWSLGFPWFIAIIFISAVLLMVKREYARGTRGDDFNVSPETQKTGTRTP